MIARLIDAGIKLLLIGLSVGGTLYLFRSLVLDFIAFARREILGLAHRRHLRVAMQYAKESGALYTRQPRSWEQHIENLLASTLDIKNVEIAARRFPLYSLLFAGAVYVFAYFLTDSFFLPLVIATPSIMFPYVYLQVRRYRLSIANSYDIVPAIDLLLAKYRVHRKNMKYALPAVIEELPHNAIRRGLIRYYVRLERHASDAEAQAAKRDFQEHTGTNLAIQLSEIIYQGVVEGLNVEASLERLMKKVTDIQNTMKEQKYNRVDTMLIGVFPIIVLLGGLVLIYVYITRKAFEYQFHTASGVFDFTLAMLFSVLGLIVAIVFYKPKQDI